MHIVNQKSLNNYSTMHIVNQKSLNNYSTMHIVNQSFTLKELQDQQLLVTTWKPKDNNEVAGELNSEIKFKST